MKIVQIPKRNGEYRTIYVPDKKEKQKFKNLLGELNRKAKNILSNAVHGFVPGRSPVTNALAHVGYEYTISFDLEDFFDTVTPEKVSKYLTKEEKETVFVDGAARQGLPTSPVVANLAAADMDKAILKWIKKTQKNIVYTRYADDLTLSFNEPELIPVIKDKIPEIVKRNGFKINEKKTRVQAAIAGRRIICGIAVDKNGIYPTREVKRRLRAALHQGKIRQAKGLEEWMKLKLPNSEKKEEKIKRIEEAKVLIELWGIKKIDVEKALREKAIPEMDLGDNCYITNDPAYIFGMSYFTTGWRSCMAPDGGYGKGVVTWMMLSGTSVAVFLSDRKKATGSVERRVMRARCLVHRLRTGELVYDRLYGNPQDIEFLKKKLEEHGIKSAREMPKDSKLYVVGNVSRSLPQPYYDTLRKEKVVLKESQKKAYRFFI
ncbi:Reverse transcriptase (RNA-dependent DNA polymerase) [Thermoanaerobacter thermohydrosulfuricus]|uniref:RNA-directed DNA polymerase n=1 Tax=Thermoanaerobacter thermohydrosulfuricus TaxID=1516 RepID=A0A1G7UPP1_THETY|nr:reverse transcriptase family protein [Thermoanaerobacter thermohydrosulfuricus]SDG49079.1 Reverse transcriptase (RNA-dependent DNA polymerase) [Thermoanaerobacter thermohydrosulfuricus]